MKLQPSPVKALALEHGLAVAQPRSLRLDGKFADDAAAARAALRGAAPDVLVVAAYGLILPPWVLALPRLGCLNIHASLLPRWRGAAPIQRAIEAGDAETGITHHADGRRPRHRRRCCWPSDADRADDTSATLRDAPGRARRPAGRRGAGRRGRRPVAATPQPDSGVTYAAKMRRPRRRSTGAQPAAAIERRLRAFDPFPGARSVARRRVDQVLARRRSRRRQRRARAR